jgi:hypothetical protein
MKKSLSCFFGALILLFGFNTAYVVGEEYPGEAIEHPGEEISADFVKKIVKENINVQSMAQGGVIIIHDDKLNKNWRLKTSRIHDTVYSFEKDGRTIYVASVNFKSLDSPDVLDIDFWFVRKDDNLLLIDTRIHKVNGIPRYTYEGTKLKEIK